MATGLVFIVPAYNEAGALPGVLRDLREHWPEAEVVVVNDGSTDGTGALARRLGAQVLDLACNLGIGSAVQAGLLFARDGGYEIAVQFDGDGQHRADQVDRLLAPIRAGQAEVVIGSRFLSPSSYHAPLDRRIGMAVFRRVNSLLVGRRITDSTSGFRAYAGAAVAFLAAEYPHDYPEPESVVTLARHGYRLREVSVEMRGRVAGTSSISLGRSLYYMVKVLLAVAVGATRRPARRVAHELAGAGRSNSC